MEWYYLAFIIVLLMTLILIYWTKPEVENFTAPLEDILSSTPLKELHLKGIAKFKGKLLDIRKNSLRAPSKKPYIVRAGGSMLRAAPMAPLEPPTVEPPEYFSWTQEDPLDRYSPTGKILTDVHNQLHCGSCWAFALTEVLADRISVKTKGKIREPLSVQYVLECNCNKQTMSACCGGVPYEAVEALISKGVPIEKDYPYTAGSNECPAGATQCLSDPCPSLPSGTKTFHFADVINVCDPGGWNGGGTPPDLPPDTLKKNISRMKHEIMTNGPIIGQIVVYNDLYQYHPSCVTCSIKEGKCECSTGASVDADNPLCQQCIASTLHQTCFCTDSKGRLHQKQPDNAVYIHGPNAQTLGGHAIEVVGWSNETPHAAGYWVVKNSWSDTWGINGYFFLRMGTNEAGIENLCVTGTINEEDL